jgi:hypothetical protein
MIARIGPSMLSLTSAFLGAFFSLMLSFSRLEYHHRARV